MKYSPARGLLCAVLHVSGLHKLLVSLPTLSVPLPPSPPPSPIAHSPPGPPPSTSYPSSDKRTGSTVQLSAPLLRYESSLQRTPIRRHLSMQALSCHLVQSLKPLRRWLATMGVWLGTQHSHISARILNKAAGAEVPRQHGSLLGASEVTQI